MKTPPANVITTRRAADAVLAQIPDKPYAACNAKERAVFDKHAALMTAHRMAVKAWRNLP